MVTYRLLGVFWQEGGSIGEAEQHKLCHDQRQTQVGCQVVEGVTLEALQGKEQKCY